jgi:hypothetical protein
VISRNPLHTIRLNLVAEPAQSSAAAAGVSRVPLWKLYALILLGYALALGIVGSALASHYGFPLDDSWIHQSVARNFAHSGSLGYSPSQASSGSTSLLWTLIVASNYLFAPRLDPVIFTLIINTVCIFAIGILVLHIGLRDGMPAYLALIVAVTPALDGNYVWLAFTGMEHLLFVALSIGAIWFWLAPTKEANRASWIATVLAGICMGLLCMTRPEGLALSALLLIGSQLIPRCRTRSRAQVAVATAITLVLACIPFGINIHTSHSLLPVTFKGRQWLFVSAHEGWLTTRVLLLEQWISRPFKTVLAFDGVDLSLFGRMAMFATLAVILFLTFRALRFLVRSRSRLLLAVCAWGAVHALLYALMLPSSGHGGRYQPFLLLLLMPLLGMGLIDVFRNSVFPRIVGTPLLLGSVGAASLIMWNNVLASGVDHIQHTHAVVSAWLTHNLPGETVAVFDIGRIGYDRGAAGDPGLIDLGGLTDASYIDYLFSHRVPLYLAQRNIHYVVLPTGPEGTSRIADDLGLANNRNVVRSTVLRVCSAVSDWQLGWSETRSASQCQQIDRVRMTF